MRLKPVYLALHFAALVLFLPRAIPGHRSGLSAQVNSIRMKSFSVSSIK